MACVIDPWSVLLLNSLGYNSALERDCGPNSTTRTISVRQHDTAVGSDLTRAELTFDFWQLNSNASMAIIPWPINGLLSGEQDTDTSTEVNMHS